jgi:glutamine synthetase
MEEYETLRERTEADQIQFIDFRVVDLVGNFRHISIPAARFTEDLLEKGVGFDGSNYGYRKIAGSDMVLIPDLSTCGGLLD